MDAITSATSDYDVFLSFRGPDTRYGVTDHLYERLCEAGLRVFRDDEGIRRGQVIAGELHLAILNSRFYAVVFSRNYASSKWCLRELAMMVELLRDTTVVGSQKLILPIFHGADPCDVKLQTDLYRKALEMHEGRCGGREDVKKWEEAVKTVGRISGWEFKAIQKEGRFVSLIVQDILMKLGVKDRSLPVHLIGMEGRLSEILNMLNCDSSGEIRVVVLHGMGGIGKTTLASAVYNQISSQFEGSSFLPNIRESSLKGDLGIANLQNKLSSDIPSFHQLRSQEVYGGKKRMLIIFDDVDQTSQLKKLTGDNLGWLGLGSRIMITTRDSSICNGFINDGVLLHSYEMMKMNDDHALQLFSRHAFGTDEPPWDYVSFSKQIVDASGNLPLALEVIGGHLCCQNVDFWECTLEKLKQVPPKEVFNILRISFEGLDFREKEIFLDIACFPQELSRTYAYQLWEARNLYPKCGVAVLVNQSLIKVLPYDDEFWIHDQLRDMGREIIRIDGLGSPGKFSRIWDSADSLNMVFENIIAMDLWEHSKGRRFNLSGLSNLLYLQLRGGKLIGDFNNLWARLMWLYWDGCPKGLNSTFFKMNNLVVLKISGLKTGYGHVGKLFMPNLRVLEMIHSRIRKLPDVSLCLKLKVICFGTCRELQSIHHSIGKLENLTTLTITFCSSLTSLPEELGCAKALREIILNWTRIESIPESIGRLESLTVLKLNNNSIRKLPTSICDLKNLNELDVSENLLDDGIPEEIGRLSGLVKLNLGNSHIRRLPTTIGKLSSLDSLDLERCNMLRELPELPHSLSQLSFSSRSLQVIPDLSPIVNLTMVIICDGNCLRSDYLGAPADDLGSHGQIINVSWLVELHKMKSLHLCTGMRTIVHLTTELGSLFNLQKLLISCPDLTYVSQLPPNMSMLVLLNSRTMILRENFSKLGFLKHLELHYSTLTVIQLNGLHLLDNLRKLIFRGCKDLKRLSNLAKLRRLTSLSLEICPKLVEIPGIEELEMLENLTIVLCESIPSIPDLADLTRLKSVIIIECPSLVKVPRMIDHCSLTISGSHNFFEGTYRQFELHGEQHVGV